MIVDDSFNYHSLSFTIMFEIKRSMIVQTCAIVEIIINYHDRLNGPLVVIARKLFAAG